MADQNLNIKVTSDSSDAEKQFKDFVTRFSQVSKTAFEQATQVAKQSAEEQKNAYKSAISIISNLDKSLAQTEKDIEREKTNAIKQSVRQEEQAKKQLAKEVETIARQKAKAEEQAEREFQNYLKQEKQKEAQLLRQQSSQVVAQAERDAKQIRASQQRMYESLFSSNNQVSQSNKGSNINPSLLADWTIIAAGILTAINYVKQYATEIYELTLKGAEFKNMQKHFEEMNGGIEQSAIKMDKLRTASKGNLSDEAILKYINRLDELDYSTNDSISLLQSATKIHHDLGISIEEATNKLTRFIETGSKKGAYQIGLDVNVIKDKMEEYAKSQGKVLSNLDEESVKSVRKIVTLQLLADKQNGINENLKTEADKLAEVNAKWENFKTKTEGILSTTIVKVLDDIGNGLERIGITSKGGEQGLSDFTGWLIKATQWTNLFSLSIKALVLAFDNKYIKAAVQEMKNAYDWIKDKIPFGNKNKGYAEGDWEEAPIMSPTREDMLPALNNKTKKEKTSKPKKEKEDIPLTPSEQDKAAYEQWLELQKRDNTLTLDNITAKNEYFKSLEEIALLEYKNNEGNKEKYKAWQDYKKLVDDTQKEINVFEKAYMDAEEKRYQADKIRWEADKKFNEERTKALEDLNKAKIAFNISQMPEGANKINAQLLEENRLLDEKYKNELASLRLFPTKLALVQEEINAQKKLNKEKADYNIAEIKRQETQRRAKAVMDMSMQAFNAFGNIMAETENKGQGFKNLLKQLATNLINYVETEFLAAEATTFFKAILSAGITLTSDLVWSALGFAALEAAKGSISALYTGTNNWGGGLALVGDDRGKLTPYSEIINLPKGSQVFNNATTVKMLNPVNNNQNIEVHNHYHNLIDGMTFKSKTDILYKNGKSKTVF